MKKIIKIVDTSYSFKSIVGLEFEIKSINYDNNLIGIKIDSLAIIEKLTDKICMSEHSDLLIDIIKDINTISFMKDWYFNSDEYKIISND